MTSPTTELRDRLAAGQQVVALGAPIPLLARVVENAGADAVYLGGAALAHTLLGQPDVGLLTLPEVVNATVRIKDVTRLPIIVDIDTGFGGVPNVARAVRELEHAGAAAVQIEDQTFPKRCGHFAGKDVVSRSEHVGRIIATVKARTTDLVVIGRTDSLGVHGVDEALIRARAMVRAGADAIFVESPPDRATLELLARELADVPLVANLVEGGRTPLLSHQELTALGFQLVLHPGLTTRVSAAAAEEVATALMQSGDASSVAGLAYEFTSFNQLLGLDALHDFEDRVSTAASLVEKYPDQTHEHSLESED